MLREAILSHPPVFINPINPISATHVKKNNFPSPPPFSFTPHYITPHTHTHTEALMSPVGPYVESPFQPRVLIEDFADTKEYGLPRVP
jgi:hypothetical protein